MKSDNLVRKIMHLRINSFYSSVERLKNKKLIGKPIIIEDLKNKGIVSACSHESRHLRINKGMQNSIAKEICPEAVFISRSFKDYIRASALITEILADHTPVLEKLGVDEYFIDFSGFSTYSECLDFALNLKQILFKVSGFTFSFGISASKMVSKIATEKAFQNEGIVILPHEINDFLAPLPISILPVADERVTQLLAAKGIRKIGVLREMPKTMLEGLLGKVGGEILKCANGTDNSVIEPYQIPKTISGEVTLKEKQEFKAIGSELERLTQKLGLQLRKEKKLAGYLTLKLQYSNYKIVSKKINFSYSSSDAFLLTAVTTLITELFDNNLTIHHLSIRTGDLISQTYNQLPLFGNCNTDSKTPVSQHYTTYKTNKNAFLNSTDLSMTSSLFSNLNR